MKIEIFHRTWWRENPNWPNGLEPCPGKRTHVKYVYTEREARKFCEEHNKHRPHSWLRLSRKYEYESQ
jgi:hypothetical protein